MARISGLVVSVCVLLLWFVENGLAYRSDANRLRWTPDSGNAIVEAVGGRHGSEEARVFSRDRDEGPSSSPSFYEEISRKLSDLEAKVEELSTQNGLLRKKVEESEGQNRKLALLVAKLEHVLGVPDLEVHVDEENTSDRREDGDVGRDDNLNEKRIETLAEYLGNR